GLMLVRKIHSYLRGRRTYLRLVLFAAVLLIRWRWRRLRRSRDS
ncbi:hypothetical protein AVDCRST_MAG84-3112, partial [uncultured Microcoleus sp.]